MKFKKSARQKWDDASLIVNRFKMQNETDMRLYVKNNLGEKEPLSSWWVSLNDIEDLMNLTKAKIGSAAVSGIRIYPALQNKNKNNEFVDEYHTIVIVGTTADNNGNHNNVKISEIQEFVLPCPKHCNKNLEAEF